jgi:hypothetical protein
MFCLDEDLYNILVTSSCGPYEVILYEQLSCDKSINKLMSSDFHVYSGVVDTDLEVGFCPLPVVPSYRVLTLRPEGDMLRSEHLRRSTKVARL